MNKKIQGQGQNSDVYRVNDGKERKMIGEDGRWRKEDGGRRKD